MTDARPQPASIGPFVVLRKLGEGAMGVVYAGYDLGLDRKVALKLVRPVHVHDAAIRQRMVREAQAMARLSHPNVVQVYQVGEHDGGLYVAMEYIEGRTLTEWLRGQRPPWQAALRTVCGAGRGLAAAHAAGLIHRDFKPDNVIVDTSGQARVVDFGLVQSGGLAPERESSAEMIRASQSGAGETVEGAAVTWSARLTQGGHAIGTPAYMSPEQHFGRPIGPYSDQFSFAITLYEALYGELPFPATSWDGIRRQIRAGLVPAPEPGCPVPWRLYRVIARALALVPQDRWPSVEAMIAALEHDPRRHRLRIAASVGVLGLASGISYAIASTQVAPAPLPCQAAAHELAEVWHSGRAEALARAFRATGAPFSDDAVARVRERLDGYTRAWAEENQAACELYAAGGQAVRAIDLRLACLGRRKTHLSQLVDVFLAADREVVENAVQATAALPSVATCSDADALVAIAPPDDPRAAARVEELRARLARAAVLEDTGQFEAGLQLVLEVRAVADALGYAPLAAEAALAEGKLQIAAASPVKAETALVQALRLGIAHDLHAITAEAAVRRIFVLGEGLDRRAEALAAEAYADALVERSRDDGRLSALLHNNLGAVYDLAGDVETARSYYARTIYQLQRRPGPPDPLIAITHHNLGSMYIDRGDFERAREYFTQAIELFTSILGEAHPFVAHALAGLGDADADTDHEAARASYVRSLARMESAYGLDHLYLLHPLTGLGAVHVKLGRTVDAEQCFSRAVAIADKLGRVHPLLGQALEGLGGLAAAGAPERARALYQRASEVYAAVGEQANSERAVLRAMQLAPATPAPTGAK